MQVQIATIDHRPWTILILVLMFLSSSQSSLAQKNFFRPIQQVLEKHRAKTDWEYYKKNGHTNPKWDALIEAGFSAWESHNLDTAVSFFERARALGCKDGLVLYKLGVHLEIQGLLEEAVKIYHLAEPVLRNRYSKHEVTQEFSEHLGRLYYKMEKYEDALKRYLEAIQQNGENFARLFLVGQMYRIKKQGKEAIAYLERALTYETKESIPQNLKISARIELLKLYYDGGDNDKALLIAEQILTEDPQNPTAISYRDQIIHRRAKQEERKRLKKILEKY